MKFGYFVNADETWLMTKKNYYSKAEAVFVGTGVHITLEERPYLGAPIGTEEYNVSSMEDKVKEWVEELNLLVDIACSQPHAAYAAFTRSLTGRWIYLSRTVSNIAPALLPLELVIRSRLIPVLTMADHH